jgi:hypothetical protein
LNNLPPAPNQWEREIVSNKNILRRRRPERIERSLAIIGRFSGSSTGAQEPSEGQKSYKVGWAGIAGENCDVLIFRAASRAIPRMVGVY